MENLFEKGCLVQLSASVWGAARKIQPAQLIDKIATPEWLTASKKLVEPDALKPIKRVVNASLRISQRRGSSGHLRQRQLLEAEGVDFIGERIPKAFRWDARA